MVHRPFQLNPDVPDGPGQAVPASEHYERKFGPRFHQLQEHLAQVAAADQIEYRPDRILLANTMRAHRLLWLAARDHGTEVQERLSECLFRAYFGEGRDVSDPDALAEIAGEAGMDAARARSFLGGVEGAAEVALQIRDGHRLGVKAVPTFVFDGRRAVVGAQDAETLVEVLRRGLRG